MNNWKDILKKVSERELLDAEDFAPEEMQEWRDERVDEENLYLVEKFSKYFDKLEYWLREMEPSDKRTLLVYFLSKSRKFQEKNEGKNMQRMWQSVLLALRDVENSPFKR